MIFSHESPEYAENVATFRTIEKHNGAYYYSQEILQHFVPNIETDRNWVTVNVQGNCWDHSIFFIHNNVVPRLYDWLADYKDLVLVCGIPETVRKVRHLGHAVYLPLSIDVEYVRRFAREKDRDTAFVGRPSKLREHRFNAWTDCITGKPRDELLKEVARYRKVYAVGRCAIEARALGCEVLFYDQRFRDPDFWKVVDSRDAAFMLQTILDAYDGY